MQGMDTSPALAYALLLLSLTDDTDSMVHLWSALAASGHTRKRRAGGKIWSPNL